ncbi:TPA: hypothetical protein QDE50_18505 [Burkholderia cenocepacia]|nr:hypothetical protein [Burkholderia cenocepacia]HDR9886360.1 hypothetical protein [Burkholderia cenocepacia]
MLSGEAGFSFTAVHFKLLSRFSHMPNDGRAGQSSDKTVFRHPVRSNGSMCGQRVAADGQAPAARATCTAVP